MVVVLDQPNVHVLAEKYIILLLIKIEWSNLILSNRPDFLFKKDFGIPECGVSRTIQCLESNKFNTVAAASGSVEALLLH